MGKDETADERARAIEWLREVEASAAELVEVGDLLFARGAPTDPALLQRYRLYERVKAAFSLPPRPLKGRYCDGSVKTILPIRRAVEVSQKAPTGEANRLVCIACQPEARSYDALDNPGDIIQFVGRVSDVAADDIINYDTEYVRREHPGKKLALIRPERLVSVEINKPKLEISNFDTNDIMAMISLGRATAAKSIQTGDLKDGIANGFFG